MLITVKIEVTRDDDVDIRGEKADQIVEQLQEQIEGSVSLDDIIKYAGTDREESVSLVLAVTEIEKS